MMAIDRRLQVIISKHTQLNKQAYIFPASYSHSIYLHVVFECDTDSFFFRVATKQSDPVRREQGILHGLAWSPINDGDDFNYSMIFPK